VLAHHAGGADPSGQIAAATDVRRRLQLVLAGLWLLDGVLQFQPYMYTKSFPMMTLRPVAEGNPGWVAGPVRWMADLVSAHSVSTNTAFAVAQVALGLAIAYRPTLRPALAASVAWSMGVWWFGEGFGGLLAGTADPLTGAPGAVVLYAVVAVLLWPSRNAAPFQAAAWIGGRAARLVWLAVWGLLAVLALLPDNRTPDTVHDAVTGSDSGAPSGLVWLDDRVGNLVAGRGTGIMIALGVLFALVAIAVWLPWHGAVTAGLVCALVLSAVIWVFGEGFGMPFQGLATDPNTGPLLALLAAAYWPVGVQAAASKGKIA
jgi:hypothetical protein